MANQFLSYAGWTVLPNLVTGWVQSLYYAITIRAGDPKPQPGSPRYVKHRRRILILVIASYLLYSIFEADWEIRRAGDFYQDLGVSTDADDRAIKSRFRRLAALHHPDKVSATEGRADSDTYFLHLRKAQETLIDPNKRFAYERFGPDMLEWQHCSSIQDYLAIGLQKILPYYIAGGFFMIVLGILGYLETGRYWRFISSAMLLIFELYTVTRPYFSPLSTKIINPLLAHVASHPPLLPFQQLIMARKLVLTLFLAITQLGPILEQPDKKLQPSSAEAQSQQLDRLDHLSKAADIEATRLLGFDMAPFAGNEKAVKDVKTKLQEWLVQHAVRATPEVRNAVGKVMTRRRADAPAGAKGTR